MITRLMRAVLRRATAFLEPGIAVLPMPREPLIARRPRDPVALAELRHRPVAALKVADKLPALDRRIRFHPRHPPGVNDVAGLLSTMSPDHTQLPAFSFQLSAFSFQLSASGSV